MVRADPAPFLRARWLFLRALGAILGSAFVSLWFQIPGLIGPNGILPAREYLGYAKGAVGARAYWLIPSLLWIDTGRLALTVLVIVGLVASVAIVLNLWPRGAIAVAMVAFLSFVTAAQEFSGYQSDGMLLEAAFLSLFLAPRGLRPGIGAHDPPKRAAVFLLQWLWFRVYFESGLVKILSGEVQWRNLTAMDKYYENGPLPTWIAWYAQQLPHGFHAATALATLLIELFVVWLVFAPRRARIAAFLHHRAVAARDHSHGQLRVSELPRAGAGSDVARGEAPHPASGPPSPRGAGGGDCRSSRCPQRFFSRS